MVGAVLLTSFHITQLALQLTTGTLVATLSPVKLFSALLLITYRHVNTTTLLVRSVGLTIPAGKFLSSYFSIKLTVKEAATLW